MKVIKVVIKVVIVMKQPTSEELSKEYQNMLSVIAKYLDPMTVLSAKDRFIFLGIPEEEGYDSDRREFFVQVLSRNIRNYGMTIETYYAIALRNRKK